MKKKPHQVNVRLLRKIKREILKRPHQFNMDWWFESKDSKGDPAKGCGTAACIGGWAIVLTKRPKTKRVKGLSCGIDGVGAMAGQLLSLTPDQKMLLFDEYSWPRRFRSDNAKTAKGAARLAAKRIDHFIKTGK